MRIPITFVLLLTCCMVPLAAVEGAPAATKAELKSSFDGRSAQIAAAKAVGTIGECTDGMVAAVTVPADPAIVALVEAENGDRTRLYQLLASETNASTAQIGERNAMRNYQNAKAGEWLRTRDGQWKKK